MEYSSICTVGDYLGIFFHVYKYVEMFFSLYLEISSICAECEMSFHLYRLGNLRNFTRRRYFIVTGFLEGPTTRLPGSDVQKRNSIQSHKLAGWILTTAYISLKAVWQNWQWISYRIYAYRSVHTAWQQLAYKWWSQSISLGGQRWCWHSTLVTKCSGLLDNKIKGIRHCASNITEAHGKYQWLWLLVMQLFMHCVVKTFFLYFKLKIRLPSNNIYFTVSLQLSSYILTKLILLTKLSILFQSSIIILNSTWVHSQTCFTTFLAGCAQQRQHFKWNLLVFCLISLFWFWGQGKDTYLS